ncbi:ESX secretion-associated protein EspG [Nocardia sp. NPDC051832]|uniref:ESX secretion-associated protein EspG n=1 Tax=Nocardia sp. NPDC051832 TaxID=3155673 RepID=UPI0034241DC4
MSERRWQLSGLMFQMAVEGFERDRLPYPIRVLVQDPAVETGEDFERLRARTAQQMAPFANQDLFEALKVLLEPSIRVEVHGLYGRDFQQVVRAHAGIVGDVATVAIQKPGPTQQYGGDILLVHGSAETVVPKILAALPKCEGGRFPAVTGHRSDLKQTQYAKHPTRLSPTEEVRRIAGRPRSGLGEITVYRGPAIDSRPTSDGHGLHWLDYLPHDGRYLLHNHTPDEFTLTPAPHPELQRHLHDLITTTAGRR